MVHLMRDWERNVLTRTRPISRRGETMRWIVLAMLAAAWIGSEIARPKTDGFNPFDTRLQDGIEVTDCSMNAESC